MGGQSADFLGSKKWPIFHSESEFYIFIHIVMLLTNITKLYSAFHANALETTPRFILVSPFLLVFTANVPWD